MDPAALTGLAVAVAVLLAATLAGLAWRHGNGRLRNAQPVGDGIEEALGALGVSLGRVTLLQFSSAFCAPCRVAARVCGEVAGEHAGVVHVEVDAESHLAEVRRLGVWRTPTVLVVDPSGRVAHRATGAPGKVALADAVSALLPARVPAPGTGDH